MSTSDQEELERLFEELHAEHEAYIASVDTALNDLFLRVVSDLLDLGFQAENKGRTRH